MFVADAHCDTLYAIAIKGRRPGKCAVTPQRLKAGGVGLQTFALFAGRQGPKGTPYADGLVMLAGASWLEAPMLTDMLPNQPRNPPWAFIHAKAARCLRGRWNA